LNFCFHGSPRRGFRLKPLSVGVYVTPSHGGKVPAKTVKHE